MPPTIIEPIGAGLIVALVNKFIINNEKLWSNCGCDKPVVIEEIHEDSSSSATSINDAAVHMHHIY